MRLGIIRETKTPPDSRVLFTPKQCSILKSKGLEVLVQPSESRCYLDSEYEAEGIVLQEDLSDCDILFGVKEVKIDALIPNKTYFFFSHTIKKQSYNKKLLQEVIKKKIHLVDYETLKNEQGARVIAFGRWAGIVGAHNGIRTWGLRTGKFELTPMNQSHNFSKVQEAYPQIDLGNAKIVLTGTGRVANGSAEVLDLMKIRRVSSVDFLTQQFNEAVYCQLETEEMFGKGENDTFDTGFYSDPSGYHSLFKPYTQVADIMINGIYWDSNGPAFFSKEDMKDADFNIKVIADITCDIAPDSSVPSTLKATTIQEPIFGYDVLLEIETEPFKNGVVDVMSVDNLPNELPRDASKDFGEQFLQNVLPELIKVDSDMIYKASITTKNGILNKPYLYLTDYISN